MNSGILASLRQWWQSLGQTQKILFLLGCVAILAVIGVLGRFILRPAYAPLFTELGPQDAARIIEQLESTQTPYRLAGNGTIIEVPKDLVYKLRIQMASAGILYNNGAGFELFDEKKFGITEFEQHVGYQRALQEELRRTIVQLDEVEQARVHLVLPRESVFIDEKVTPSASIALKLKPFAKLEPNQVQGIQSLVMGSVQGLSPENIHIIDMHGNVLNEFLAYANGDSYAVPSHRFELKRQLEKELESRVQQMLNHILGPGRAVTMVTAELDFDQEETVRTEYGPGSVLSEQTINETGSSEAAGGIPGADSEMPGVTMPFADTGGGSSYSKEQTTTNYQVDTTRQTVIKAPGNIRRLSVSVVVDGEYNQEQLESLQQVVAAAVGYDAARGDQLAVSSMTFNEASIPSFQEETPASPQPPAALPLQRQFIVAGAAAGALLLLLLLFLLLRRRARRRREMLLQQQAAEEARRKAAQEAEQEKEIVIEEPKPGYRTLIKKIARERPSDVVEILKVWLKE